LLLVVLPFFTSFLIRVYAWIGILSREGLLNELLLSLGVISAPLEILSTNVAVVIGMVYSYFPFMALPLYAALEKMDDSLLEAAADLGATPARAFWRVTVPVSTPGIVAGALLCFIPAVGEFVIPDLLGGSETQMIGRTVWNEFANNRSWTVSSALAILILLVLLVPILIYQRMQLRELERD
ncbi:MAG: ABC transporter permease, partial [Xanthobacteraceae bacterium]|nr:ABC transporter permease [Xanthobacteraceae bacterium]